MEIVKNPKIPPLPKIEWQRAPGYEAGDYSPMCFIDPDGNKFNMTANGETVKVILKDGRTGVDFDVYGAWWKAHAVLTSGELNFSILDNQE